MATFKEQVIALLNKVIRRDLFTNDYVNGICHEINLIDEILAAIKGDFYFDTLEINGVRWWEQLLELRTDETASIENRRSRIQAKWLSSNHNSILLIQGVCDSWKQGEIKADFTEGKIKLEFINEYGIPQDLDSLINAIDEIKPAHLAYLLVFKFLLKKNIHNVLTKSEMEAFKKSVYCDVRTGA